MKNRILKLIFIILMLLIIVACGNKDKSLDKKFLGTYIEENKNLISVVKLENKNETLYIYYEEKMKDNNIITEKVSIEIDNALFKYDKEKNKYTLNKETIKDLRAKKETYDFFAHKYETIEYKNYKDYCQAIDLDGITMYFEENKTRNEILLYLWSPDIGVKFISFVGGFKK